MLDLPHLADGWSVHIDVVQALHGRSWTIHANNAGQQATGVALSNTSSSAGMVGPQFTSKVRSTTGEGTAQAQAQATSHLVAGGRKMSCDILK